MSIDLNKISLFLLSVDTSHSKEKSSASWNYFGKLIYEKTGTNTHIIPEKVFCAACLSDARAKYNQEEMNADNKDGAEEPHIPEAFGSFGIKSYSTNVSTGNLSRHLREDHGIMESKAPRKVATLRNYFSTTQRFRSCTVTNKDEKFLLARDLALWFCRDLQPFSVSADSGMLDFMRKRGIIGSQENLPNRTTISRDTLNDVYSAMLDEVKQELKSSGKFGALTFDLWTDGFRRRSYITFTYNFISDDMEKVNLTLRTIVMQERKTGENIRKEIFNVRQLFNLQNRVIHAVIDAGANVKLACKMAGVDNHLCLGHGLHNLIQKDGLQQNGRVYDVVQKATKIIGALRYRAPELEAEMDKINRQLLLDIQEAGNVLEFEEMYPLQARSQDFVSGGAQK